MRKIIILLLKFVLILRQTHTFPDKLSNFFHQPSKNPKTIDLIIDYSEYPRNDLFKQIHRQHWNAYYQCLTDKNTRVSNHTSPLTEIATFASGSITLPCDICVSPLELKSPNRVGWFCGDRITDMTGLETSEGALVNPSNNNLHIYGVRPDQRGWYQCRLGQIESSIYFVSVFGDDERYRMVKPDRSPRGPYAEREIILENIVVYTKWLEWSECSMCNAVGKRKRYGICTVWFLDTFQNQTILDDKRPNQPKIPHESLKLLRMFKDGIACRSRILPSDFRQIPAVKNRPSEIMEAFCYKSCDTSDIFQVRDKLGHVLEEANNSAGIYSMLQAIPVATTVERRTSYANVGDNLKLACPGSSHTNTPILWKINDEPIIAEILNLHKPNRLTINAREQITIQNIQQTDTAIFSCWQNDKLLGTIRVIVSKPFNFNVNHHIILLGLILIIATFLFVFIRVIFQRKSIKE